MSSGASAVAVEGVDIWSYYSKGIPAELNEKNPLSSVLSPELKNGAIRKAVSKRVERKILLLFFS